MMVGARKQATNPRSMLTVRHLARILSSRTPDMNGSARPHFEERPNQMQGNRRKWFQLEKVEMLNLEGHARYNGDMGTQRGAVEHVPINQLPRLSKPPASLYVESM